MCCLKNIDVDELRDLFLPIGCGGITTMDDGLRKRLDHEQDIDELRRLGVTLATEVELLQRRMARLTARLAEAEGSSVQELFDKEASAHERSMARTKPGGAGSERSDNNPRRDNETPKSKPPVSGRKQETVQYLLELDEADQMCPCCGGDLKRRESLDNTSKLVTIEHHFVVELEVTSAGYGCACGHIEHAPPHDDQLRPGGRYGVPFVVASLILKYWHSMPLNRQVKFFASHGLEVTTQSLWDNSHFAARLLEPVYDALLGQVRAGDVVHADETRWRVRKGKGEHWSWVVGNDDTMVFAIRKGRDHTIAEELLSYFAGTLVVDGMTAYTTAIDNINRARSQPELWKPPPTITRPIVRAGCWAHARSYWVRAAEDFDDAQSVIHLVGKLFTIVEAAERHELDDDLRLDWVEAALDAIKTAAEAIDPLPGSSLHEARRYLLNQWDRLTVFRDDRAVPLTNNCAERALRNLVLGRLNFQGAKSDRGNRVAEVMYTLIATCVINGISPPDYLEAAIAAAKEGRQLLPLEFQRAE